MDPDQSTSTQVVTVDRGLYDKILKYSGLPILIILVLASWGIINYLMSPKWQQARRNKQIRRAVAERQALMEEQQAANDNAVSQEKKTPVS